MISFPLDDLKPGTMRRMEAGESVLLVARVGNEVFAIDDLCTHEDASLSTGRLEQDRVKCPLHGSRFCLRTGVPLEEPADEPVRCYPVSVESGIVSIALTPPEER